MRSCCVAQGTISSLLRQTMMEDKKGNVYMYICLTGSLLYTAEIGTTLYSYTLKNVNATKYKILKYFHVY